MKFRLIAPLFLSLAITLPSYAQAPQVRGDEKKQDTNCPPSDTSNSQKIEDSAILPSAGGHKDSAAPTTQRSGETVVADSKCKQEPATPKDQQNQKQ
jgi:hypothetical protein